MSNMEDTKNDAKGRWRVTQAQTNGLEAVFAVAQRPHKSAIQQLAVMLKVKPRQVQVWFQNRRQRFRREMTGAQESLICGKALDYQACMAGANSMEPFPAAPTNVNPSSGSNLNESSLSTMPAHSAGLTSSARMPQAGIPIPPYWDQLFTVDSDSLLKPHANLAAMHTVNGVRATVSGAPQVGAFMHDNAEAMLRMLRGFQMPNVPHMPGMQQNMQNIQKSMQNMQNLQSMHPSIFGYPVPPLNAYGQGESGFFNPNETSLSFMQQGALDLNHSTTTTTMETGFSETASLNVNSTPSTDEASGKMPRSESNVAFDEICGSSDDTVWLGSEWLLD